MTPQETPTKPTFPVNDDTIKAAVTKTVLESMDTLTREKLLHGAIEHVLNFRPQGSYGRTEPTLLEDAFNRAVETFAKEEVARLLKEDPRVRAAITDLVQKAWEKAVAETPHRVELISRLAEAIGKGFVVTHTRDY